METKRLRRVFIAGLMVMMGMSMNAQDRREFLQAKDGKAKAWIHVGENDQVQHLGDRLFVTPKQKSPQRKDDEKMVTVKCVFEYNPDIVQPNTIVNVLGDGYSTDIYSWEEYTQVLPAGEYDFLCYFIPVSEDDNNVYFNIKEKINIKNDITICFDASECKNHLEITAYNPDGEIFKRDRQKWNEETGQYEVSEKGNVEAVFTSTRIYRKDDMCSLYTDLVSGYFEFYFNDISDRLLITQSRLYYDKTEKQQLYATAFCTDDVTTPLQDKAEDYFYHEEEFSSSLKGMDSEKGAAALVSEIYQNRLMSWLGVQLDKGDKVVKMYVNMPKQDQNGYRILARPAISDVMMDQIIDFGDGDVVVFENGLKYDVIGLPVILDNGDIFYPNIGPASFYGDSWCLKALDDLTYLSDYNEAFSFTGKQKALNYGSSTPINLFCRQSPYHSVQCFHIGRYGECRTVDNMALEMTMKLNGEDIECNYDNFSDFFNPWEYPDRVKGDVDLTFDNQNMMVDGLQGRNLTTIHYNEAQEDTYAPTLTMLWFKNKEDIIIDRFETADDGILEFSGGDLNYHFNEEMYTGYFDCAEQTVEVAYSPYGKDSWSELAVEEIPENYFMPGFGYFYRGSLKDVTGVGEKGWFDLKIRLEDKSGNWQEQVVSPAFRIDDLVDTGIENIEHSILNIEHCGAVYDVMGRLVGNGQCSMVNAQSNKGIRIVRKANGDVRKVVVR